MVNFGVYGRHLDEFKLYKKKFYKPDKLQSEKTWIGD